MAHLPLIAPFAALAAAFVAGSFSLLNLVSTKENRVSEFRQAWIDGLREELAQYASAVDRLALLEMKLEEQTNKDSDKEGKGNEDDKITKKEALELTDDAHRKAAELYSKVIMRLNPDQVMKLGTKEALLYDAICLPNKHINKKRYIEARKSAGDICSVAAPLLKDAWETVKNGEGGYRNIRDFGTAGVIAMLAMLFILAIMVGWYH